MSLQGTLESFALPDVLVLLSSTKKTGELKVVGARGEGRVWVDKGEIIHSQKDGKETSPVDTVFELLRLETGTFSFGNDAEAPSRGEAQLVDLVLSDAQARLAEWKDIERVVPHLDAVIDIAPDAPGDEVTVTNAQWKLLVAVAGGHSVQTLMDRLDRGEFDTCKAVKELVEARLATIDVSTKPSKAGDTKADAKADDKAAQKPGANKDEAEAAKADDKAGDKAAAKVGESKDDDADGDDDSDQLNRARRVRSTTSSVGASSDSGSKPGDRVTALKDGESAALPTVGNRNGNGAGKAELDKKADDDTSKGDEVKDDDTDALVAQLAALGVDEDDPEAKEKIAARLAEESAASEGDEPINRGLLLKFLSSVRN